MKGEEGIATWNEFEAAEQTAMRMGGNDEEIGKFATLRLKVASRLMTLKEAIAEAWAIVNGKSVDH